MPRCEYMNSFVSAETIKSYGFKECGEDVKISKNACFYGIENIKIGNKVRIDDFCILSGNITIGNNVHIAAGTFLFGGKAGIYIGDYSTLSSRCGVYAVSDDYSGESMTNPTIPEKYKNVKEDPVFIDRHVIIGTGTSILSGVSIAEGVAVGSMSLVLKNLDKWTIYAGIPCGKIRDRNSKPLKLEEDYIKELDKISDNNIIE